MKQKFLMVNNFQFPLFEGFLYLDENIFRTPLNMQFHIFQVCIVLCNVCPTLSHLQLTHISHCNLVALMFC
jgi:hypothetical protein